MRSGGSNRTARNATNWKGGIIRAQAEGMRRKRRLLSDDATQVHQATATGQPESGGREGRRLLSEDAAQVHQASGTGQPDSSSSSEAEELSLTEHACDSRVPAPGSGAEWWEHLKYGHRLPHHHLFW